MRLPDAGGFIAAAQKALSDGFDVVYLHDSEGAPAMVLLTMEFYREMTATPDFPPREYMHDHIEPDMDDDELPWGT